MTVLGLLMHQKRLVSAGTAGPGGTVYRNSASSDVVVALTPMPLSLALWDNYISGVYSLHRWRNWAMTNLGGLLFKNGNLILKIIYE